MANKSSQGPDDDYSPFRNRENFLKNIKNDGFTRQDIPIYARPILAVGEFAKILKASIPITCLPPFIDPPPLVLSN